MPRTPSTPDPRDEDVEHRPRSRSRARTKGKDKGKDKGKGKQQGFDDAVARGDEHGGGEGFRLDEDKGKGKDKDKGKNKDKGFFSFREPK